MNLWDISVPYLIAGLIFWLLFSVIFIWKSELIGSAVFALFFFSELILNVFLRGQHIPNGQLVMILFGPLLLISVLFRQKSAVQVRNVIPLLLFAVTIFISIIWNDMSFWRYKVQLLPPIFAIIVYLSISKPRELDFLLMVFAVLVVINTFVAGLQFAGITAMYLPSQLDQAEAGGFRRGVGLLNHFWQTGLLCGATIPLAVIGAVTADKRTKRLIWAAVGIIALAGLAFTRLRAGFVGGVMGGVFALFLWNKRRAIPYLFMAGVVSILFFVSVPFLREASTGLVEHATTLDSSALNRPYLISLGMKKFYQSPVFGSGPRSVEREYGRGDAHNSYVNVLGDYGIIGFLAFLMILVSTFRCLRQALNRIPEHRNVIIGTTGMLTAAYIIALAHSVNYIEMFWLFPALALSVGRFQKESTSRIASQQVVKK